jgi:two-component system, chemotaxis family, response regulator Rcp1
MSNHRELRILLVDDNLGDLLLTKEALKGAGTKSTVSTVSDGVEAMQFLRREGKFADAQRPDLIFLDLNMPRMTGGEVLTALKEDDHLKDIPVVVLTSSDADDDVSMAYHRHANCFVTKPADLDQMIHVVQAIDSFWMSVAKLPPQAN